MIKINFRERCSDIICDWCGATERVTDAAAMEADGCILCAATAGWFRVSKDTHVCLRCRMNGRPGTNDPKLLETKDHSEV